MAGIGPQPKDPKRRVRNNKDPVPTTVLEFVPGEVPELPTFQIDVEGQLEEFKWHSRTYVWWEVWRNSPQAELFGQSDWDFLIDTALIHTRFWNGNMNVAAELRLRVAKFGATPEDRARLRYQFAQADEADAKRPEVPSSKQRRGGTLRAMDLPLEEAG